MLKLNLCRYFLTGLVFFAVAAKAGTVIPAINSPAIRTAHISGTTIEYIDIGAGAYTLVVESGVGMGLSYWQPLLADFAKLPLRTIIYSRAGNGGSDKANDVSLAASNKRLALLLQKIAAENPLILLGHSFGAMHSRTFAGAFHQRNISQNSFKIAGLVLLDPSHELFSHALYTLDKTWAARDDASLNQMMGQQPEWLQLQQVYQQQKLADQQITQHLPTVLVTSSKRNESDWWIGHGPQGKQQWRGLHHKLIDQNPKSVHFVTNQAGHNVPLDDKNLVFEAINALLFLIKSA